MSLIIKGSIMPLMCGDCPCYDGSDYACNATGRGVIEYRYDGRPDNCPLVEIPTPHGRMIDADRLMEVIEKNSYLLKGYYNSLENGMFLTGIKQAINEAPTIIEAEVSE